MTVWVILQITYEEVSHLNYEITQITTFDLEGLIRVGNLRGNE